MKANEIVEALINISDGKIWCKELPFFGGKRRADFWTLEPIMSKGFRATAYEIKVTRADFKNDNEEKQAPALLYSDRFFYVTPPDLITKQELPEWAGLMEWNGKFFSVKKKAPKREKIDPNWSFIVDLVRSSGQCQRDVELMKSELAFYKGYYERFQKANDNRRYAMRSKWQFEKYKDENSKYHHSFFG